MESIILASESQRRQEYFELLGLPFTCVPSMIDESLIEGISIENAVEDLARRKVRKVVEILKDTPPLWVAGADTVIAISENPDEKTDEKSNEKIFGKPADREDARRMLSIFQGRTHSVITALALYNGRKKTVDSQSVTSYVTLAKLSPGEIEWYLDSGEWQGAAGAYKIQGLASCFITEIKGSFSSIVGLPLREFYAMLRDNGYPYGG